MQHASPLTLQKRVTQALADWAVCVLTQSQPGKMLSYEAAYEPIREIADRYTPEDHKTLRFLAAHDPWLTTRDCDTYYDPDSAHKGEDLVVYENTYQHLVSTLEATLSAGWEEPASANVYVAIEGTCDTFFLKKVIKALARDPHD